MRNILLILFINILFAFTCFPQLKRGQIDPSKSFIPQPHYVEEYTFDTSSNPSLWSSQKEGLNVSFVSTDELYMRCEVPSLVTGSRMWEESGWRGERLNTQILIWSPDSLNQVRCELSDMKDTGGNILGRNNFRFYMIRYVLSNFPYGATNAGCDAVVNDSAYLVPDRLEALTRFDLPARTVRPVWLTADIPEKTLPGTYTGILKVISGKYTSSMNLKIKIVDLLLPDTGEWKFRLDLWQNPWVIAWYYHVEPWSEEHLMLLKKHLKLYADAGGKFITTYAVHSPWSDNSYMIEGGMIEWMKQKDKSWKFDYKIFDQYVQLALDAGINGAITIYTPIPWGFRFRYLEEATNQYVVEEWPPESEMFRKVWKYFLDDLKIHLEQKGWLSKTYLGINENPLATTLAAVTFIKEHSKSWKITYAGDWHPELSSFIDDYSCVIHAEPDSIGLKDRKAKGLTTTFYVCCAPSLPNDFVFSHPVESRFMGWYSAARGYDGFLRWAYDAWPADPIRDARHTLWPAGDCFLVYPGGNSSIRFEKLREGISDFEKIRIIREIAAVSPDPKMKDSLKEFDKFMDSFNAAFPINRKESSLEEISKWVTDGRRKLNEMSDYLIHLK
jgi:hypothetical protein